MVAREFRGQSASTEETFSPTTPLVLLKVFMVISLVQKLMMSALDVSDAFLQVWQKENVVVSVPNWARVAANDISLMFWQLRKCLPGQRNAATRWNDHLTQLLEELNFVHMQRTIFWHREREIFISAHIDDLLLVANKEDTEDRGDLQQAFREVDAEERWTFWCKPHCVLWENLGVTWCKPRTWRCTTQKLNISPLRWLGGMVLMKGVMENLMRLSSTVTAIGQVARWRENRRHQVSSSWTHAVCAVTVVHRCQFPSPQWKLKFLQPRVCWWKMFSWNNYFNSFLETMVDWATMLKCKWDCDWIQQVHKASSIDLDLV